MGTSTKSRFDMIVAVHGPTVKKSDFDKADADGRYRLAGEMLVNIDYFDQIKQYVQPDQWGNSWIVIKTKDEDYWMICLPTVADLKGFYDEAKRRGEKHLSLIGFKREIDE